MRRAWTVAIAIGLLAAACGRLPEVRGEVEAVDADRRTITLNHEPIPNVQMPAMQMMFAVGDAAMLSGINPGDKVRFTADFVNGTLSVTAVRRDPDAAR